MRKKKKCKWKHEYGELYSFSCKKHDFTDYYDEDFVYCPYCGRKIKFKGEKKDGK